MEPAVRKVIKKKKKEKKSIKSHIKYMFTSDIYKYYIQFMSSDTLFPNVPRDRFRLLWTALSL